MTTPTCPLFSRFGFPLLLSCAASQLAAAAPRDIQIRSIDFEESVIELFNFGTTVEPLDGWRFCSHDENQNRVYSPPTGLNGESIAPGDSLYLHFLNDAPDGDDQAINISSVGAVAGPLDRGPYAIQLYFAPVNFGNGNTIADHLQWSIDGVDDAGAGERSDEAEEGGVWADQSQWIATTATSSLLVLTDTTGGVSHSPADYDIDPSPPEVDPFELLSITGSPDGQISIAWETQADVSYEVQRGTDLEGFTTIGATPGGAFTDPSPPAGRAFYRVIGSFSR